MKYVQFYNLMTESFYDGFVVKEDATTYHTLDPICFEWLSSTQQLHLIDQFEAKKWDKDFFPYTEGKLSEKWSAIRNHSWLFDFPIHEENVKYTHFICNYFDWFRQNQKLSVHERINQAKSSTYYLLPEDIQLELANFIHQHYNDVSDSN